MTTSGGFRTVDPNLREVRVEVGGTGRQPGLDDVAARFSAVLHQEGSPDWLGQVIDGVGDLAADTFGSAAGGAHLRAACHRTGRLVSILCAEQDRVLARARTGRLIRTVAQTEHGAMLCMSVVPGHHVVGFVLDGGGHTDVSAADRSVIRLIDDLRNDLGLSSQNPGGLARRRSSATRPAVPADTAAPCGTPAVSSGGAGALFDAARGVVDVEPVHWVTQVQGREVAFVVDRFDDAALAKHFLPMSVPSRRRYYARFAADAPAVVNNFNRVVRQVLDEPIQRLVLDVEQGVLVVHRLGTQDHLIGLSLEQSQVEATEHALAGLAAHHPRS